MRIRLRLFVGVLLWVSLPACREHDRPEGLAREELIPGFVELQEIGMPPGSPPPRQRPALWLSPADQELHLRGWTEDDVPRLAESVFPIPEGRPLAMCWRPTAELAVAILAEDGQTLIRSWTWDGRELRASPGSPLYEGPAGTVTSMDADPGTGALFLLDAEHARLLEVTGPTTTRTLADATTIPPLAGRRSLVITRDLSPAGSATLTLTTTPSDADSIDDSDGVLELRDQDPTDGQIDTWTLHRP